MQILMGAHATVISINESKIHTKNLLFFIKTNLTSYKQYKNSIVLNHSTQEHYARVFLLKWLYNMHKNVIKKDVPNLKELLVQRVNKPIRIEFKNRVEKKLSVNVDVISENTISMCLITYNDYDFNSFVSLLKKKIDDFLIDGRYINIKVQDQHTKHILKELLFSEQKDMAFLFINKNRLENMLNPMIVCDEFQSALMLLNAQEEETLKNVKAKYKKLLKIYHPDNVFNQDCEREYTEKFQKLQSAYEVISKRLI